MYYLLENNEIVNSDVFSVWLEEKSKTDEDYNITSKEFIEAHISKVIKQSENVFDLIDREKDLLKIGVLGYPNIMEAKSINGSFKDMHNILAIYKPNQKGDFIKAWESEKQ